MSTNLFTFYQDMSPVILLIDMNISGIYKIINRVNEKYYVGSSENIKVRWSKHKTCLKYNRHWNSKLQNAWNKYGKENFEFVIVENQIPSAQLLETEQKYLDVCKQNPETNYMISYDAVSPMRGRKSSEETRQKLRNRTLPKENYFGRIPPNKGMKMSDEQKEKLRLAANKQFTDEFRKQHSELCKSKEHRDKISNGKKDKTVLTLINETTQETFVGCGFDWYMRYFGKRPCNYPQFRHGLRKKLHGWVILSKY